MNKEILKTKTFWASVVVVVGAVGSYFMGELSGQAAFESAAGAILTVCLRDGIISGGK